MSDEEESSSSSPPAEEVEQEKFCIVNPGQVLVLEADEPMDPHVYTRIKQGLESAHERTGVKFVLLPYGIRAARIRDND